MKCHKCKKELGKDKHYSLCAMHMNCANDSLAEQEKEIIEHGLHPYLKIFSERVDLAEKVDELLDKINKLLDQEGFWQVKAGEIFDVHFKIGYFKGYQKGVKDAQARQAAKSKSL